MHTNNSTPFFRSSPMQGNKVALPQQRYFFGCSVALANGYNSPTYFCKLSNCSKTIVLSRGYFARFYFCYFMLSYGGENCCIFRAVFVWWRKGYNFNRFFIPTAIIYCRFVVIFNDSSGYFVQTAYISPFAFFVKYFKIISTDGLIVNVISVSLAFITR